MDIIEKIMAQAIEYVRRDKHAKPAIVVMGVNQYHKIIEYHHRLNIMPTDRNVINIGSFKFQIVIDHERTGAEPVVYCEPPFHFKF